MKGMYGGPRGIKGGDYLRANIKKNSGKTEGGIMSHPTSVNGNIDTVRKIIPSGRIKK
jgi:hypothetical protein